jgi:hypothetical protein
MASGMAPAFLPREMTILVAATTTAQAVALPGTGDDVRVVNNSTVAIRVAFGFAVADAAANCVAPVVGTPANSLLLMPGEIEIFAITDKIKALAVLTTSGTASVEFTRGDGN